MDLAGEDHRERAWGGLRTWAVTSPQRTVCRWARALLDCLGAQHPQSLACLASGPLRSPLMVSVRAFLEEGGGVGCGAGPYSPPPTSRGRGRAASAEGSAAVCSRPEPHSWHS